MSCLFSDTPVHSLVEKRGRTVLIVAEIGVNFRDMREAEVMIGLAKHAGADAVKFQVYDQENLYKIGPGGDVLLHPKREQLIEIMLDKDKLERLKNVADGAEIEFIATPMFPEAVNWLNDIGVKRFKIRYADRCNTPILEKVLDTGKQVIISCDFTYTVISDTWYQPDFNKVSLMYCISEYPPTEVVLPQTFGLFTGYSNHYPSIVPPLVAAARGCRILEVHVKQEGTKPIDDAVSITFPELGELVKLVREMEDVV